MRLPEYVCAVRTVPRGGSWHGQRCAQVLEAEQERARDEEKAREQQIRELKARARAREFYVPDACYISQHHPRR